MKQIGNIVDLAKAQNQSSEESENTRNQKKEGDASVNFPKWLNDMFLLFSMNYESLWVDSMPDERSTLLKKSMWHEMLKEYLPETINLASRAALKKHPSFPPKIGELLALCDEFVKTNKYQWHQVESKPERKDPNSKFSYTASNPQPPCSPLLQEYMNKNNLNGGISPEDGKKWFYELRESLRKKEERRENNASG